MQPHANGTRALLTMVFACISLLSSPMFAQIPAQIDLDKAVNDFIVLQNDHEAKKPKLVAKYLLHELLTVRLEAADSLNTMGLPTGILTRYQLAEVSGDAAKIVMARQAIQDWVDNKSVTSPDPVIDSYTHESAVGGLLSKWTHNVIYWRQPGEYAFLLGKSLVDFVPKLRNDNERGEVVSTFISILDNDELLSEIGLPDDLNTVTADGRIVYDTKAVADRWLQPLTQWMVSNLPYLYFHPKERRLKLDVTARTAGIPSKNYRLNNPWGQNEGPNLTDPHKEMPSNFAGPAGDFKN